MSSSVKLTFSRDTIVSGLEASLEKRVEERQAKKDRIDAKNKDAADRIKKLIDTYPQFLVWLNSRLEEGFGESATHADLETEVDKSFGRGIVTSDPDKPDPDAELKRLITVYKSVSTDTVELEEHDNVLGYLSGD